MKWIYGTVTDFAETEYSRIRKDLTPTRAARIDRLRFHRDQHRSLTGDLLAEKLLAEQFGIADGRLEVSSTGQPLLVGSDLHISIAHCETAVVCAAAEQPVGIDIEKIRPMDLAITRHICTPEEMDYLFGHPPAPEELTLCRDPEILQKFFEIWTAKEAYFKCLGTGITNLLGISILPLSRKIILKDSFIITIVTAPGAH